MANIFINYRRADSITVAFIIYNKLIEKKHRVFIDKEAIPVGFDFAAFISKRIKEYDVMLTLIGNQWLTIKDDKNNLRLRKPDDHVRLELAEGLQTSSVKVIPVLIDKVQMPAEKSLTGDLKKLSKLNAVDFTSYEYDKSAGRVLAEIERTLNLLRSKDISEFIKVVSEMEDRVVTLLLKSGMEAFLKATIGITAGINFEKLDDDTAFVAKLKKGQGRFMLSALYAAEQFGVQFDSWKEKGKTNKIKKDIPFDGYLKRFTLNSMDEIITHLNANRPVLAEVSVYEDTWMSKSVSKDGMILSLPKPGSAMMGKHAVLISQVDLIKNRIKFANSWGKEWGDRGFGYFSEETFNKYVDQDKLFAIETVLSQNK
jgi:hypothetical protein